MVSPSAFTSSSRLPRIESYFSRWARVAASVMSFTATNSISLSWSAARRMLRPMRPKPLMPTRMAMLTSFPPESTKRGPGGRDAVSSRRPGSAIDVRRPRRRRPAHFRRAVPPGRGDPQRRGRDHGRGGRDRLRELADGGDLRLRARGAGRPAGGAAPDPGRGTGRLRELADGGDLRLRDRGDGRPAGGAAPDPGRGSGRLRPAHGPAHAGRLRAVRGQLPPEGRPALLGGGQRLAPPRRVRPDRGNR